MDEAPSRRQHEARAGRLDTVAARRSLVDAAKQAAREEDSALKAEGLHIGSSDEKVASYRGVGLGLYFKVLHWLFWMMIWMMLCSVPYLIAINTSVFTDFTHRYDHGYGVKVYDRFEMSSFTFAAIVDDKKDNGTLQYMNTEIADAWKGPMKKGVFLTWISLLDAGATVTMTGVVVVLFILVRRWLEKVDLKTREVSDYAVIVGGLPPYITATEVGEYFEKHFAEDTKTDKVMDVVLIRGFATVVNACKEVHRNEQLKRFVAGMGAKRGAASPPPPPPASPPPSTPRAKTDKDDGKLTSPMTSPVRAPAPPPTPLSPATGGSKTTFNLTAVAVGSGGAAAPPMPLSPRPATPAQVDPEAGLVHDQEQEGGSFSLSASGSASASMMTYDMSREMAKVEAGIEEQYDSVMGSLREGKLRSNAAIVTFNTEHMRARVCEQMPSGWWASLLMRRELRLQQGGRLWRPWARRAAAPDDYRFENISTRIRTNVIIQVFTGLIMFAFIVVCGAFITWLSAESNKQSQIILWDMGELLAAIGIGMAKANAASPSAGLNQASYDAYCSSSMPSCAAYVVDEFAGVPLNVTYGSVWSFPNATSRLLNERPMRQSLLKCAESVSCPASYCLPCYCLGLSSLPTGDATPEFLTHLKDTCSDYWKPFDLRREGIAVAISVVIAVINSLLTFVLRILKFHVEKHWTTTDTELSFAVWSYLVKLVNSVAILLVVNCSTLKNLQKRALAHESRWMQRLVLDGLFDDFSPDWYASIGFSVLILMMINVAGPLIRSAVEAGVKWALRARLLYGHMGKLAAPEDYNVAFRAQQFTLESRISDVLFNVTLALIFGSGMPLCYLIAAAYLLVAFWWDRLQLLSWRQPAQRYNKHLPRVIMYLLPVLLLAHCAFGLWMHTYFKAELSSMDLVAAASNGLDKRGISSLSNNTLARRITQPNGLALLIWFLVLGVWLLFGRWFLLAAEKVLGGSFAALAALLRPKGRRDSSHDQSDVTYEEALSTVKVANQLRGARTYRIHHLTNYKPFLSNDGAAGKLWTLAQGDRRFTRLTTFRVHVEMEVTEGHRVRHEEREVEMFDVADTAITSLPNAAAALAAVNAAAAASAEAAAATRDTPPPTPALPLPPCMAPPPTAAAQAEPPSPVPTAEPAASDPALRGLVPSAALQTATLQQVATLQANTGAVVKRVSLRALPEGLVMEADGAASDAAAEASASPAVVVAPPPELPPFELDLQPVVVRSLASLRLLPTAANKQQQQSQHQTQKQQQGARGGGGGSGGDGDSGQVLRVPRSASVASAASSSRVSVFTTHSAPATCPAAGAAGGAAAAEITAAKADRADGNVGGDVDPDSTEAAVVVQAEAVVLAEAISVGSKGGGVVAKSPSSTLKARAAAAVAGSPSSARRDSPGPRARASFRHGARPSPLEELTKQILKASVLAAAPQSPLVLAKEGGGVVVAKEAETVGQADVGVEVGGGEARAETMRSPVSLVQVTAKKV